MKKSLIIFCLILNLTPIVRAQKRISDTEPSPNTTSIPRKLDIPYEKVYKAASKISFDQITHDFGKIPQSIPVSYEFEFTNKGIDTIALVDVHSSCGCTTPDWNNNPVLPSKKRKVKVTYNSVQPGDFEKEITLKFNNGSIEIITIKGSVIPSSKPNN